MKSYEYEVPLKEFECPVCKDTVKYVIGANAEQFYMAHYYRHQLEQMAKQ